MRCRKDSGFSLLEIIIVLAIIGGILVSYTYYARQKAEKAAQQSVANALVAEIKGVINFARESEIALIRGSQSEDEITNPLYDENLSPDPGYDRRITNAIDATDTGSANNYFLWSKSSNSKKQQRYLFLSSKCNVTLKSTYAFDKEYLSCFMSSQATNSLAVIDRIGMASGTTTERARDINRIDVIIKFIKNGKNSSYQFADYAPHFTGALEAANISASHAIVLHRNSSTENWKLVVEKKDNKTPVELGTIASNMDAVTQYSSGEFGVRFTFDLNDNTNGSSDSSGGGGGGASCWNSGDVSLCYNKDEGQGEHGEDMVLSLDMTDKSNSNGNAMTGTLKANVVMENTSRRIYLFKRTPGGNLDMASNDLPLRYTYTDKNGDNFEGDFVMDDDTAKMAYDEHHYYSNYQVYSTRTYDAFELTTPVTSEYHAFKDSGMDVTDRNNYVPDYDDAALTGNTDYGGIRIPVQSCPQVKQSVSLRDGQGDFILNDTGATKKLEIIRKLYPRLSVSVSSVAAYNLNGMLSNDPSNTRNKLDNSVVVSHLAGVATQINFAENNQQYRSGSDGINTGAHVVYEDSKYLWIISATVGLYDGNTGKGTTLVNPPSVGYTVSRWCSTIPQPGTPADVLETYEYK